MLQAEFCIALKRKLTASVGGLLHFNCARASNQMARWRPPNGGRRGKGDRNFAPEATSIIPESYHKLAYVLDCASQGRGQIPCTIVHRRKSGTLVNE